MADALNQFERTKENHHPQTGSSPRFQIKEIARTHTQKTRCMSRCSRPLCSSQTTTPSTTPTTHNMRSGRWSQEQQETPEEFPALLQKRPCCLRTQQCAKHNPHNQHPGTRSQQHPPPKRDRHRRTNTRTPTTQAMPQNDLLIFHP
jgi:hypothetical protein